MKVYLAGPEVFLPDAVGIGIAKRRICSEHGLVGIYPLDNELEGHGLQKEEFAQAIFHANCAAMDEADAIIANMTPFRSISMDVGTAFEMGYMFAQAKPVLGYSNAYGSYIQRALEAGLLRPGTQIDPSGMTVENFGLADNLMMACAVRATGFDVIAQERRTLPLESLYTDLTLFSACVEAIAHQQGGKDRRQPQRA